MMQSFNFFKPYLNQKQISSKQKICLALAGVFLILGGIYGWNSYTATQLQIRVAAQEAYLQSRETQELKKQIADTKNKLAIMESYHQAVERISTRLQQEDSIRLDVLNRIASAVPEELFFQSLSITGDEVVLRGTTGTREAVAELEYNLKESGLFREIHVNSIAKEPGLTGQYDFGLDGTLK